MIKYTHTSIPVIVINSKGNMNNSLFKTAIHVLITEASKLYKLSYILGSQAAFFTTSQFVGPLIGFWGGVIGSVIACLLRTGISWYALGLSVALAYHIPTLCGALYIASNSRMYKIMGALLAITIFITHPVGSQAYYYSFYWFIPVLIALSNTRSIFLLNLGSTFMTHAVGSIIWLYTHALTATDWQLLCAVVWYERLLLALGMTVVYYSAVHAYNFFTQNKLIRTAPKACA